MSPLQTTEADRVISITHPHTPACLAPKFQPLCAYLGDLYTALCSTSTNTDGEITKKYRKGGKRRGFEGTDHRSYDVQLQISHQILSKEGSSRREEDHASQGDLGL